MSRNDDYGTGGTSGQGAGAGTGAGGFGGGEDNYGVRLLCHRTLVSNRLSDDGHSLVSNEAVAWLVTTLMVPQAVLPVAWPAVWVGPTRMALQALRAPQALVPAA